MEDSFEGRFVAVVFQRNSENDHCAHRDVRRRDGGRSDSGL
jgi:hypothetical protein